MTTTTNRFDRITRAGHHYAFFNSREAKVVKNQICAACGCKATMLCDEKTPFCGPECLDVSRQSRNETAYELREAIDAPFAADAESVEAAAPTSDIFYGDDVLVVSAPDETNGLTNEVEPEPITTAPAETPLYETEADAEETDELAPGTRDFAKLKAAELSHQNPDVTCIVYRDGGKWDAHCSDETADFSTSVELAEVYRNGKLMAWPKGETPQAVPASVTAPSKSGLADPSVVVNLETGEPMTEEEIAAMEAQPEVSAEPAKKGRAEKSSEPAYDILFRAEGGRSAVLATVATEKDAYRALVDESKKLCGVEFDCTGSWDTGYALQPLDQPWSAVVGSLFIVKTGTTELALTWKPGSERSAIHPARLQKLAMNAVRKGLETAYKVLVDAPSEEAAMNVTDWALRLAKLTNETTLDSFRPYAHPDAPIDDAHYLVSEKAQKAA